MTPLPPPARPGHRLGRVLFCAALGSSFVTSGVAAAPEKTSVAKDTKAQKRAKKTKPKWIQLWNGKDLTGWTPKIRGHALGENFARTYRAEGGLLKVSYDGYGGRFDGRFGHLAYKTPYSHYRLRVEYRFVGEQPSDGEAWAFKNSGVMIHGQPPETMALDQKFPVSIEVQLLGGKDGGERPTANVCSPGTHIVMAGKLVTKHCNDSQAPTFRGQEWVTLELEVRGGARVRHIVNGETVLEYEEPQLDPSDAQAKALMKGDEKRLEGGYIYLQSESHPIEFRRIELQEIDPAAPL